MNRDKRIGPVDLERMVELDLVRTTEAAALHVYRLFGKGDAKAAHAGVVDAIRGTLDLINLSGTVVFGDGLNKLGLVGIEPGEHLGNWAEGSLKVDLALVPIDGVELVANGYWSAVSYLVAARGEEGKPGLMPVPCRYMEKIAYGPAVAAGPGQVHMNASVRDNLELIAELLGKRTQDLFVAVLDRPRHSKLIADIRKSGASVRLRSDGDIASCLAPSVPDSGVDVYMGTGGSAEAVVAAAGVRCMGGDMLVRLAPENDDEKQSCVDVLGEDSLAKQFRATDLACGPNMVFCATGISDGTILRGVHINGKNATTSSVVMRIRYKTVRRITAIHDLSVKTIRLRSANAEMNL